MAEQRALRGVGSNVLAGPELAFVAPRAGLRPVLQHDLDPFRETCLVLADRGVGAEGTPVGDRRPLCECDVQAPAGCVIEIRQAHGEHTRVVERHDVCARPKADVVRITQRLGEQQVGCRDRLPRDGEVLADPGLRVPESISLLEYLDVPSVGFAERSLRRVARHEKQANLHDREDRQRFGAELQGSGRRLGFPQWQARTRATAPEVLSPSDALDPAEVAAEPRSSADTRSHVGTNARLASARRIASS